MDGGQYMGDNGIFVEEIPERMQAEVSTEYGKFIVAMHQVSSDGGSPEVYYYHGDHLGSASWITDASGAAVQHLQYLPFGERFVDQRTSGYSERFTFTGKERDEETGYGYFGARYMDYELMTMWLSVDPLADKYPSISPYNYCMWNPIKVIDPMGMDTINTTDPSKPESKQLSKACKSSYPGMLIVNGHGAVPEGYPSSQSTTVKFDNNRYTMYNGSIEMKNGNTPEGIADFLKQYNGVYEENSRQGGLTIVILVVCRAGTELQVPEYPQDNIAQTLSKEMPNAIIIAPSWDVTLNYNLEYNNMNVYKDPYRHMPGHWNVYREGKKLDELPNYARLNSLVRVVPKRAFGYRYLIH
jgi:RHS repeat-associated protein